MEAVVLQPSARASDAREAGETASAGHASGSNDGERDAAAASRLAGAVTALERRFPAFSARSGLSPAQRLTLVGLAAASLLAVAVVPGPYLRALQLLLAMTFAVPLVVRLLAIGVSMMTAHRSPDGNGCRSGPGETVLPVYTVLVALYREAPVIPQLIEALRSIDYPPDRLDVIFAVEAGDQETSAALFAAGLPSHMRIVVVPDGTPRTKPRALCYALSFARGSYVTVYDAEDQPEPDQLLKAVQAFSIAKPDLGCLQAPLNIYNRRESWLTRQFAIEYTALFDAILPAYVQLRIPVPLGGTSNHFPRAVLEEVGGWDPYNVTEDADLGVRLARFGYRVEVLRSTTWEEAPPRMRDWFHQRTRWQKGWLQTYFVHMRDPKALWRDLGPVPWLWFQVVIGGGLISAFAHPWLYAWLLWHWAGPRSGPLAFSLGSGLFWWTAVAGMAATCLAAITLAVLTLRNRGFGDLVVSAFLVPLYWLPISLAAYRAAWECLVAPFYWAKTPHSPRKSEAGVPMRAPLP